MKLPSLWGLGKGKFIAFTLVSGKSISTTTAHLH